MALMFVVIQSHFIINNIFEGIIWVFLPIALVVTNDIFAYIFGKLFGRTPLIQLSPKKTWEGFLGAWISTVIIGIFFAGVMRHYPYFLCPIKDVSVNAWSGVTCDPNTVFEPIENDHIPWIMGLIRRITGEVTPLQLHTIVLATFASLVAPFGGFFASGVKRAFNLKDFGDSIPGHGGLTDRMDCQFIMGLFSHIYIRTFVSIETAVTVGSLLQLAIQNLSLDDQLALYHDLGNHLSDQGTIAASVQHSQLLEAGIVP
ncbi:hypothetical protein GQ42DRAFT_92647 [Ramicandelaber brevisporus]|nr:hypothetical protein GQ42DRAFT_92647 [Ramicandelaber brevisporus]